MMNILSYVGMSLQSEVCLWTLLGLVRTIFDATLFKVNANLKQVWQMSMPEELSRPVQRALRTIISGIMLVKCFTVYVYLASYIVLLYPVFLEERPTLVLPWLLLAAIRKLLCELTSLALGLGTCVLLGPARPPCVRFLVTKVASIMPSFYMWMLLYSYYHVLKVASVFKSFPVVLPPSEHDYGLELAVRRRRTKSLLREDELRTKLIENLYSERQSAVNTDVIHKKKDYSSRMTHGTDTSMEDITDDTNSLQPLSTTSNRMISDTGCYEDWFGSEVIVPRDTDRILEQFGLMMLRIGAYLTKEGAEAGTRNSHVFESGSVYKLNGRETLDSTAMPPDDTETPPLVGSSKGKTASYLREYPQIFMKRPSDMPLPSDITLSLASDDRMGPTLKNKVQTQNDGTDNTNEDIAVEKNEATQSRLSKEKTQKKLQTISSEKSVSFKQIKRKSTMLRVHSNDDESDQLKIPTKDDTLNKSNNVKPSIGQEMKASLEFKNEVSVPEDGIEDMTQEASSSKPTIGVNNVSTSTTSGQNDATNNTSSTSITNNSEKLQKR